MTRLNIVQTRGGSGVVRVIDDIVVDFIDPSHRRADLSLSMALLCDQGRRALSCKLRMTTFMKGKV